MAKVSGYDRRAARLLLGCMLNRRSFAPAVKESHQPQCVAIRDHPAVRGGSRAMDDDGESKAAVTKTLAIAHLFFYRPEQEGPQEWYPEAKVRCFAIDHPGVTDTGSRWDRRNHRASMLTCFSTSGPQSTLP